MESYWKVINRCNEDTKPLVPNRCWATVLAPITYINQNQSSNLLPCIKRQCQLPITDFETKLCHVHSTVHTQRIRDDLIPLHTWYKPSSLITTINPFVLSNSISTRMQFAAQEIAIENTKIYELLGQLIEGLLEDMETHESRIIKLKQIYSETLSQNEDFTSFKQKALDDIKKQLIKEFNTVNRQKRVLQQLDAILP